MKPGRRSFVLGILAGCAGTVVLAVVALLVGSKLYSNHVKATIEDRIGPPPVPESVEADYAWQAITLENTPFSAEAFVGKTVVLTWWKPDCFACTEQLEYLNALASRLHDIDIHFAAVSVGSAEDTRDALALVDVTIPVYVFEGTRPAAFETSTMPTTFVLAPNGRIAFRHGGIARWDDPAVETYLRALAVPERLD